jgi:hypothetical protein
MKQVLFACAIALLVACSTSSKKPRADGNLIIPYAISSLDGSATSLDCEFVFRSETQTKTQPVAFLKNLYFLEIQLPADEYSLEQIRCQERAAWEASSSPRKFLVHVYEGQSAVTEPLQILSTKNSVKADSFYDVKVQHDMIKSTLRELRPWNKQKMVSAYTQKPLTDALYLLDKSKYDRGGLVKINGQDIDVEDVGEFGFSYDKCGREESNANRLRLGSLEFRGSYEGNILKKLDVTRSDNLYCEQYENCVKNKIASFAPVITDHLREVYHLGNKFDLEFKY